MLAEKPAVDGEVLRKFVKVEVQQLFPKRVGEARLCLVQQRGEVILVVNEIDIFVLQHNVPGLEITVKEKVLFSFQKIVFQRFEIVFQGLFVKGDVGQFQEIVFEIVEVPLHRLAVEGRGGVADGKVKVFLPAQLEKRELA